MSLGHGKRSGYYNVFEMNSGLSSEFQTPTRDQLESVNDATIKTGNRTRCISILLGVTSLVICIAFLATALVYYFQLRGEWGRENIHLKEEIKALERMNSTHSLAVHQVAAMGNRDSQEISSLKTQVESLRGSLNDSASMQAVIRNLKQADFNYSRKLVRAMEIIAQTDVKLSAGVSELKEADANDAVKISSLKSEIEDLRGLWNDSKLLKEEILNLKEVDSNYSTALLVESGQREEADHLRSQAMQAKFLKHEQEHIKESLKFHEEIQRVEDKGSNQSKSAWEGVRELRRMYLNISGSLTEDIQELRQDIDEDKSYLDIEIEKRQSEDSKNSQKLMSEVQSLNEVDDKLTNSIHALQQADRNQTDALKAAEEKFIEQSQKQYSSLANWINDSRIADEAEFSNIATLLEDLKQADLNQMMKLKTDVDAVKAVNSRRFNSLVSQLQHLIDVNSNNSEALLTESVERKRMDLTLAKQIQDGINELKASQSNFSMQLANLQLQIDETKAQIRTVLTIQPKVNKLTQAINLVSDGWKGSPSNVMYKAFSKAVTFHTAVSQCRSEGGRLAAKVLRDSNIVRDIISAGFISGDSWTWIGFDDMDAEGIWRWSDGGRTVSATTRWYSGEPNNSGNEDCAVGTASSGIIKLNDLYCNAKRPYLCEVALL